MAILAQRITPEFITLWGKNRHGNNENLCRTAVVYENSHVVGVENGTCINGLQRTPAIMGDDQAPAQYVLAGLQRRDSEYSIVRKDHYIQVIDYLINKSPFRTVYENVNAEEAYDVGFLYMRSEHPANVIGAACIMPKILCEHDFVVLMFLALVKRGCPPNIAMPVAMLNTYVSSASSKGHKGESISHRGKFTGYLDPKKVPSSRGHYGIQPTFFSIRSLHDYMNSKFTYITQPFIEDHNYAGVNKLFLGPFEPEHTWNNEGYENKLPKGEVALSKFIRENLGSFNVKEQQDNIFSAIASEIHKKGNKRMAGYVTITQYATRFCHRVLPKLLRELHKYE